MLSPLGWECFPACQPRWDFPGHNSWCCALSNAQTQRWDGAVPAPGARPAESPAPPRSRSCRSLRSSPRCCGCSLCFCSPLGLLGEVEGGPLQAHRAFLQTSSQRHPAKRRKIGDPRSLGHQQLTLVSNTSGAGVLQVNNNIQNMVAHLESPRKSSNYFKCNILGAEHGTEPMPCEEHNSPAESTRLCPRAGGISLVDAKSKSTPGSHLVPELKTLWKMHLPTPLPGASWPWPPPRGLEDCTCNN